MSAIPKRRLSWRAPLGDGVAHCYHGRYPWALCGAQNLPERWDRRPESRCPRCERREQEVERERKAS